MASVKTNTPMRMKNVWRWKPPLDKRCQTFPGPGTPLPTATSCVPPQAPDPIPKRSQSLAVARYGMVVEVSRYDGSKPFPRFLYRRMHPLLELLFDSDPDYSLLRLY